MVDTKLSCPGQHSLPGHARKAQVEFCYLQALNTSLALQLRMGAYPEL
jgi:hypothetical protein